MELWYDSPSNNWNEALALGNGKLGAMVYGGVECENIQLNDETLWYRGHVDRNNPDSLKNLEKIRSLIIDKKLQEAEKLISLSMYATPRDQSHYETLGNVNINQYYDDEKELSNYRRSLDISKALMKIDYKVGDVNYNREYFISKDDNALFIKYSSDMPKKINLEVKLIRKKKFYDSIKKIENNGVILSGKLGGENGVGFKFSCKIAIDDGELDVIGETIVVKDAKEVKIVVTSDTDYYKEKLSDSKIKHRLEKLVNKDYDSVLKQHIETYQEQYNRMNINFKGLDLKDIPTNQRIKNFSRDNKDLGIVNLYFNYAKYLLISCSQPGGLPATLQGIWNDDLDPIWGSKFTLNINTEMNYWMCGPTRLTELEYPLFEMLRKMKENGKVTAKKMYGCNGYTAHHNTDGFFDTAPQSNTIAATVWVMTVPWICTHIWENYLYTEDLSILNKYYDLIKDASLFYKDYLFEYKGYLVTGPSVSPENTYKLNNGVEANVCLSPAMDSQILRYFFRICINSSKLLEDDKEYVNKMENILRKLPKDKIGKYGQIQEWLEDYEEVEPGHRHISQLFALYPGNEINKKYTPELFEAARNTIERRLSYSKKMNEFDRNEAINDWKGKGKVKSLRTGWSSAWLMNHYARLNEEEKFFDELTNLINNSTLPNLFDDHPPFQIDGNFGTAAALCEILMQSHLDYIVILPTLPKAFESGEVKNIRARGNVLLSYIWEDGKIKRLDIKTNRKKQIKLLIPSERLESSKEWIFDGYIDKNYSVDFTGN